MEIGITGLPGAGKTVVLNALSRAKVPVATYSAPVAEPNRAVVKVPDERVTALAGIFQPEKVTPAEVRYVDAAGLTSGMSGDNQAVQLLGQLRNADALLIVVRAFSAESVPHSLGSVDPDRDLDVLATELMLADLAVVERRLERLERESRNTRGAEADRQARERELVMLRALRDTLGDARPAREVVLDSADDKLLRGYGLLTRKPWLVLVNTDDDGDDRGAVERLRARWQGDGTRVAAIAGKLEMDLAELDPEEAAEFLAAWNVAEPALDRVIQMSYELLDLISFFTVGEDEVRAWTVRRGASAVNAAGAIHTDIARAFVRAEVVRYDDLLDCGTLTEARRRGLLRSEGRTYTIKDGDVAHFLHTG